MTQPPSNRTSAIQVLLVIVCGYFLLSTIHLLPNLLPGCANSINGC